MLRGLLELPWLGRYIQQIYRPIAFYNDSYTFLSIHERSAREKISADQVAHVLNDEVSRKYIQSLKRYVAGALVIRNSDS